MKLQSKWPSADDIKIAFVGDAPSSEDMTKGEPFLGPAGRVFNAMLRTANIDRDSVFLTNVFDEAVPEDKISSLVRDASKLAEANDRLMRELEHYRPNVIVPLGGVALNALTGHDKIAMFRGGVTQATRLMPGSKLLPAHHPRAVQMDWRLLTITVGDFIKAAEEATLGPKITYPKFKLILEPRLDEIMAFKAKCLTTDELSVDIETGWGTITCIGFAPDDETAMCIPFMDMRKPNKSYWASPANEVKAWLAIKEICESPVPKVGQNFTYDLIWTHQKYGIAMRNYRRDTRLQHKVLHPELPADLASMTASYTRIGSYKHWGGRYQSEEKKDN